MSSKLAVETPTLEIQDETPGYLAVAAESGSVKWVPHWMPQTDTLAAIVFGPIISVLAWAIIANDSIAFSIFFSLFPVSFIGLYFLAREHDSTTNKAVRQIRARNPSLNEKHTHDLVRNIRKGDQRQLNTNFFYTQPRRAKAGIVTVAMRQENTIHYTHFTYVPEETAWLDNFEIAMKLD